MMQTKIIDRGRGPEIEGTRITVYDIWDYAREGDHHTYIAAVLGLSSRQVNAALDYIEEHKDEVLADYQEILGRAKVPYPPEIQAKVDEVKAKAKVFWEERRKQARENGDARDHGG